MAHAGLAQLGAVLGAIGIPPLILLRHRLALLAGFAIVTVAEVALALALVPTSDLDRLQTPLHATAALFGLAAVAGGAVLFVRRPELTLPALVAAAPFRVPVQLGSQKAFLLLPIYLVLAAVAVAFLVRWLRGAPVRRIPLVLAVPTAAYVALDALSFLWTADQRQGSVDLVFFLFPFAAAFALAARAPLPAWLPRALGAIVVALGAVFTGVGVWQAQTHRVFFAHDLTVANAYTTYFRVTSLFHDPSLFGRWLMLGFAVVAVAMWLRRISPLVAAVLFAMLFVGIYYSYSQSSMVSLAAVLLAVTAIAGDRTARRGIAVASALALAAGAVFLGSYLARHPARKVTSDRTHLVSVTTRVIAAHPLVGVGVGGQPKASHDEAKKHGPASKDASHTTPLTVAAELGVGGVALYLAFLAGSALVLLEATRRRRALGLGLAAMFLGLVVHSLFYAGFFDDPVTLGLVGLAAAVSVSEPVAAAAAAPVPAAPAASTGSQAFAPRPDVRPSHRS